eukprot:6212578-Pleurochrysis_carterae.AAC.3
MPAFLAVKPRLHVRHVFGAATPMADACSRGRFQQLYALCARLGVHLKCLQVPPDVAAFLGSLVPEHGVFHFHLLPLMAGDVELHPGPSGGLAAIASALRDAHRPDPPPPPPAASTPLRAFARADLFLLAPMPRQPAPTHTAELQAPLRSTLRVKLL